MLLGTHISNTREAKSFALLSEEGIARGVRRITAVTTDCAFQAIELARSLEQEAEEASKLDGSFLEKVVFFLIMTCLLFRECACPFMIFYFFLDFFLSIHFCQSLIKMWSPLLKLVTHLQTWEFLLCTHKLLQFIMNVNTRAHTHPTDMPFDTSFYV